MPLIERVLGCNDYSEGLAQFPILGTPKIDGVRGYTKEGIVFSKSNKPIPNRHIQQAIPRILSDGYDFEMQATDFNTTTSVVMSEDAPITGLSVHCFDYVDPVKPITTYMGRLSSLHAAAKHFPPGFYALLPVVIHSPDQLTSFFQTTVAAGHEGIVLRRPDGTYKFGKSTQLEQLMLRLTANATSEAIIIGFNEQMTNNNPSFTSETGRSKKSKVISGLAGSGRLGSFTVRDLHTGVLFDLTASNGLSQEDCRRIWDNRDTFANLYVRYSYKSYGTIDKPRQPKFEGFRHPIDMDTL